MRLMNFPMDGHACPLKFGSCELCVLRRVSLTDSCSLCMSELLTHRDGLDVVKTSHNAHHPGYSSHDGRLGTAVAQEVEWVVWSPEGC